MKIKNLMLKNFAKVSEISVSFDENITYLVGNNGSGKTTVGLNAVWFAMKGLAQKGDGLIAERFRFIGPHGKSAKVDMTIFDEAEKLEIKISKKLLKNKTELKIEASDGRQLDQAWLDSIFNSFLIDPMGFSKLSGKDQALAFGADTSGFDLKKKEIYQERLLIGRDVERLQGVVDTAIKNGVEKAEMVDIGELMAELDARRLLNRARWEANEKLENMDKNFAESEINITTIIADIEALKIRLVKAETDLERDDEIRHDWVNKIQDMPESNEQEIKDQIESAQEINLKATAYKQFRENELELNDVKTRYEGRTDRIHEIESSRTEYLKSLKLPWPNITINDEGQFMLNDKPFCAPYFSTGEILKFGARIGSKLKDGLKYVFFPNSEALDDKNRESIFKLLNEEGFQIVAECVGTEKKKDASILLKEMRVVESYDETGSNTKTLT